MNPGEHSRQGIASGPEPIEPGRPHEALSSGATPGPLRKNRGDLVVLLGIGSLFCCPPLGVLAWIMANADLKRIQAGELSSDGLGTLRTGRAIGIVGTLLFVAILAGSIFLAWRLPWSITELQGRFHNQVQQFKKNVQEDLKPRALDKTQIPYAGEWVGDRGTVIRILLNGIGDCEYRKNGVTSRQTGGRVRILDDKLSIGIFGVYSTWRIDRKPHRVNGQWTMTLDGEVFIKKRSAPPLPREEDGNPVAPREYDV